MQKATIKGWGEKRKDLNTLKSNPADVFTTQSSLFHQFWFPANFQTTGW
jgi:hypothetical protein